MIENISTLSHTKELRLAKRVFTHNFMMWQLIPLLTTLQYVLFSSLAQHTLYLEHNTLSLDRSRNTPYLEHNTHSLVPLT